MPIDTIDPQSALVVVDLQVGITALPVIHDADEVVARSAALAAAFRERGLPVALVNVAFSADGGDVLRGRVDAPPPATKPGPDWATLRPELDQQPGDLLITKRQWDAFHGTELDLQLRRRGVRSIVLTGISTSIGVEGTARQAFARGYELVVATDAVTDMVAEAHEHSTTRILPRIARLASTDEILAALPAA